MKHFITGKRIACDTETTGLDYWHEDRPFAFSFCNEDGDTAYFEWPVDPKTRKVDIVKSDWQKLYAFFTDREITKIFFNASFDIRMLEMIGIPVAGPGGLVYDGGEFVEVMFKAFHFCNAEPTYKLKVLAQKYCEIDNADEVELKKVVQKLRREAKKLGWKIAEQTSFPVFLDEPEKKRNKDVAAADYWLPRAFLRKLGKAYKPHADLCRKYAELDVVRTMLLDKFYTGGLEKRGVTKAYEEEQRLWPCVYNMCSRGVKINPEQVWVEIAKYRAQAHEARTALRKIAEDPKRKPVWVKNTFDPDSAVQCAKLLYQKLGIPPKRFNETGSPTSDKEALVELREYPAANYIISYRTATKAVGTTFGPWTRQWRPDHIVEDCQSIHTDFQQCGPVTGRFSSRNPNLQNVSNNLLSSSLEGVLARKPFGPRPGYTWITMDYANLEVRIFAELAEEPRLIQWFQERRDVHSMMTNQIWGGDSERAIRNAVNSLDLMSNRASTPEVEAWWKEHGVTDANVHKISYDQKLKWAYDWFKGHKFIPVDAEASLSKKRTRNRTKQITFLKIFGGGVESLSVQMRSTKEEAREQMNIYNENFPLIDVFIKNIITRVKQYGYVVTPYGNRIEVSRDYPYKGSNYIVQGSAARLLKRSMILTDQYIRETGLDIHMVLTIHDELYFEFNLRHLVHPIIKHLIYLMEDPDKVWKKLDMRVDVARCDDNWEDKREVKRYSSEDPTKSSPVRWTRECLK